MKESFKYINNCKDFEKSHSKDKHVTFKVYFLFMKESFKYINNCKDFEKSHSKDKHVVTFKVYFLFMVFYKAR